MFVLICVTYAQAWRGFDARLDAVEVALGKLDQHFLTIERVVLPAAFGE